MSRFIELSLLVFTMTAVPWSSLASGHTPRYGLVIGTNTTGDSNLEPLQFADDDAAKNARLLSEIGAHVILLTQFDRDSKELYPGLLPSAPVKRAVFSAMDTLNKQMSNDLRRGKKPELYIFYSGHGDVENNQGFVHLADGKLFRKELLLLLKQSKATINHVVIDACKSYFLVFNRGPGGNRSRVNGLLPDAKDSIPSNTGVILSTSSAKNSHEWEGYQSGIFSHEIRSAMRGAADINTDGKISYLELASFIWTANISIVNRRFRPDFFSKPPMNTSEDNAVFIDMHGAKGNRLHVGPGDNRHGYIEDELGLRLADFHPGNEQKLVLLLPLRRPLFVRHPKNKQEVEIPAGKEIHLASLSIGTRRTKTRGAEHIAYRHLFSDPFNTLAVQNYRHRAPQVLETGKPLAHLTRLRQSLLIGAGVLGIAGGIMTGLAIKEQGQITNQTSGLNIDAANKQTAKFNTAAVIFYTIGASALASYLVWTLWPKKEIEIKLMPAAGIESGLHLEMDF